MNNKLKFQENINRNIRDYCDPLSKRVLNVVNLNSGSTLEHELKKSELAYNCLKNGLTFITEPKLKGIKRRPDLMVICTNKPIVYEVIKSETKESIYAKIEDYEKLGIKVVPVRC